MSAKERLTQRMPVECHLIQVDQPMSKFGMHFYGMGGPLYSSPCSRGMSIASIIPLMHVAVNVIGLSLLIAGKYMASDTVVGQAVVTVPYISVIVV